MSIKGIAIGLAVAGLAFVHSGACAQATRAPASDRASTVPADSDRAVRHFVQAFYDWYTPIALSDVRHPAWFEVLNNAGRYLDPALAAALRADSIARQADPTKQTRDVLDFDPFLASQDPCGPYTVTDVRRRSTAYRVALRHCGGKGAGPVVEVRSVAGAWRISNVLELDGGHDLKSYLCEWADKDLRAAKRPAKCP